jgi:hypothetical protein
MFKLKWNRKLLLSISLRGAALVWMADPAIHSKLSMWRRVSSRHYTIASILRRHRSKIAATSQQQYSNITATLQKQQSSEESSL